MPSQVLHFGSPITASVARRSIALRSHHSLTLRAFHANRPASTVVNFARSTSKTAKPQHAKLIYVAGGVGVTGLGVLWSIRTGSDIAEDAEDLKTLKEVTFGKLVSGWIAFALCSWPAWVDMSESLYGTISRIPIVCNIANVFVMKTFFNQFLGGETTAECVPKITTLRQGKMGTLLGYNIEAELDGSSKDPKLIAIQTQHVLDSIAAQGQLARQLSPESVPGNDNRFWVRIKLTGLLPRPIALAHGSNAIIRARAQQGLDQDVPYPGLPHDGDWDTAITGEGVTEADRQDLLSLRSTMETIASEARKNNVRVVIDAEQSWYQPVIDSLTDELLQKYNSLDGPPTCIASFQAYLRRYPQLLDQQIRRAEEKGYTLLFKQVRGAYMVSEAERWRKQNGDSESPVWSLKSETDASFNYGVEKAVSTIASQIQETGSARLGAVFATHNCFSVDLGLKLLEKSGLAKRISGSGKLLVSREAAESIAFAQLYGMKDDLSNKIIGSLEAEGGLPMVVKSMSYGDLKESLPFLARRATENKAVLEGRGGAAAERARLGREILRRATLFRSD